MLHDRVGFQVQDRNPLPRTVFNVLFCNPGRSFLLFEPSFTLFFSILEPVILTKPTKDLPRTFYVHSSNIRDETAWSEPIFFETFGFRQYASIHFTQFFYFIFNFLTSKLF
jgi:hypothetical protein